MIGDEIRKVVSAFREQLRGGEPDAQVFVHGFRHLEAMADLADRVEGEPVPLPFRIVPSPDATAPVVDLRAFRPRPAPVRDGGPAA